MEEGQKKLYLHANFTSSFSRLGRGNHMKRTVIAGAVGGIVFFIWSAIAHMFLPIGSMGVKTFDDSAVLPALQQSVTEPGFYIFPGMDMTGNATPEEQREWEDRYQAGPIGVLVYSPSGDTPMSAANMIWELLSNIVAGIFAAWIISLIPTTLGRRAAIVTAIGLIAWLSVSVSHWVWFKFPFAFTIGEGLDQVIGWLLAGLVMSAMIKPRVESTVAA